MQSGHQGNQCAVSFYKDIKVEWGRWAVQGLTSIERAQERVMWGILLKYIVYMYYYATLLYILTYANKMFFNSGFVTRKPKIH